jgi:hypothetical protein
MTLQNRVECQLRTPCEPRTGREWGHCTVRHTPNVPPEAIEAATGIPIKRLLKISSPQGDAFARPEEIAAICDATQRFDWLRFFVRRAGCELFPLPTRGGFDDLEILERTAASLRSLSAVVDTLRTITQDHRVSAEECERFDDIAGRHLAVVRELQVWVSILAGKAGPRMASHGSARPGIGRRA